MSLSFRPRLQRLDDRITPTVTLSTAQSFATGASSNNLSQIAVGDINGDGRPDLATCNSTDNTVSILFNTTASGAASTNYAPPVTINADPGLSSITLADMNGDGRVDLVTSSKSFPSGTSRVSVLLNTTAVGATIPTFASEQTSNITPSAFSISKLQVADLNGDGRLDIAVLLDSGGFTLTNSVKVLTNTTPTGSTTLTFGTSQVIDLGATQYTGFSVSDLDGDGRSDFVVSSPNGIAVMLNKTPDGWLTPSFTAPTLFTISGSPSSVQFGDFNGDGRNDLAMSTSSGATVMLNTMTAGTSTPTFSAPQNFTTPAPNGMINYGLLSVGDFNGDGRVDIAVSVSIFPSMPSISVFENTTTIGAASVTFAAAQSFAVGSQGVMVSVAAVGDFNGDGRVDIAGIYSNTVQVFGNTTDGTATTTPALVGQFGTTGVWGYNRVTNTWVQLTAADATDLAVAPNGNTVANLGGNGVWYYRPSTGWVQINSVPAAAVAIDGLGNVYASFTGIGTAIYRLYNSSWGLITGSVADKLVASANGDLVANFGGFGVYRFHASSGWVSLATPSADALVMGADGTIAASFMGYGVYRFKAGTWSLINSNPATSLAVGADGAVVASFGSMGVAKYIPYANGWQLINGAAVSPSLAMDIYGNVFTTLSGYGVYEFNTSTGLHLRRGVDSARLGLG